MKEFSFSTRITIWSILIVTAGILVSGALGVVFVYKQERDELDDELKLEARRFFENLHGAQSGDFDWHRDVKQVQEWIPASKPAHLVEVRSERNRTLYRSKHVHDDVLSQVPSGYRTISIGDHHWRIAVFHDHGITLRIGGDMEPVTELVEELLTAFLMAAPVLLAFAVIGGRFIAHKAVSPIRRLTAFAETVSVAHLDDRIDLPAADDEIRRLGVVLNDCFDRLEKSFYQASRFTADASHELKTPLTILRGEAEALLRLPDLTPAMHRGLASILEDAKRLSVITESLLLLARADAGKLALDLKPVDFGHTVAMCAEDAAILAEEWEIAFETQLLSSAMAGIDEKRVVQIVMNLFENALKYNRQGGKMRVCLTEAPENWELAVSNTGRGISPESIPHIFRRFYRGAASTDIPGHGLGLNLALELARAQGGDLVLTEAKEDWTTFTLRIPKVKESVTDPRKQSDLSGGPSPAVSNLPSEA